MKKLLPWTLILIGTVVFCAQKLVYTTSTYAAPIPPVKSGYQYITNELNGGNEYHPEYTVDLGPGTSATIARHWDVQNSFGANVGVTAEVVEAGLNYNVTWSSGVDEQCSANNQTTSHQSLIWQSVYIDWYYDIYWHNNADGTNTYQGTGWAKEYLNPACYYTGGA